MEGFRSFLLFSKMDNWTCPSWSMIRYIPSDCFLNFRQYRFFPDLKLGYSRIRIRSNITHPEQDPNHLTADPQCWSKCTLHNAVSVFSPPTDDVQLGLYSLSLLDRTKEFSIEENTPALIFFLSLFVPGQPFITKLLQNGEEKRALSVCVSFVWKISEHLNTLSFK